MKTAILNKPTPVIEQCELTFIDRASIRLETAQRQHSDYASALRRAEAQVEVLAVNHASPDAVFVEAGSIRCCLKSASGLMLLPTSRGALTCCELRIILSSMLPIPGQPIGSMLSGLRTKEWTYRNLEKLKLG